MSFLGAIKKHTDIHSEQGIALLYFSAVILPLMVVLFSITIDIATYLTEERSAQVVLDKAAVHAQRFLPYREDAEQAFLSFVEQYPSLSSGSVSFNYNPIQQQNDVLTVQYERMFRPYFANYFGGGIQFMLRARADVRATPLDVLLLLDSSHYMAPTIDSTVGWDNYGLPDSTAQIFASGLITLAQDLDGDGTTQVVPPMVLSQQCFSPPFRTLKKSAVQIYQYLASFRDNAVGVEVYPAGTPVGVSGTVELTASLRDILPSSLPDTPSELEFLSIATPFVKNEYCAAAAEREETANEFKFIVAPDDFIGLWRKAEDAPLYMIDQAADWIFDNNYQTYLSAEDLIWSQAVRPNFLAPADTVAALDSVSAKLLTTEAIENRGGLKNAALKQVILLAGDTAWSGGERLVNSDGTRNNRVANDIIQALRAIVQGIAPYPDLHFRMNYIILRHQGSATNFELGVEMLQQIINQTKTEVAEDVSSRFSIDLIWSDNPDALSSQVISYLAMSRKTGVVSR